MPGAVPCEAGTPQGQKRYHDQHQRLRLQLQLWILLHARGLRRAEHRVPVDGDHEAHERDRGEHRERDEAPVRNRLRLLRGHAEVPLAPGDLAGDVVRVRGGAQRDLEVQIAGRLAPASLAVRSRRTLLGELPARGPGAPRHVAAGVDRRAAEGDGVAVRVVHGLDEIEAGHELGDALVLVVGPRLPVAVGVGVILRVRDALNLAGVDVLPDRLHGVAGADDEHGLADLGFTIAVVEPDELSDEHVPGVVPEVVVVARGAIPSLVAQYYVESIALSALVLVDPFLLPRRVLEEATKEENEVAGATLQESAAWVLDNLESPDRCGKAELQLLEELTRGAYDRPLRLEPGSVQTHVMYTGGGHTCEAHHRKVAELVAGRHADDSGGSYRGRVEARALASEGEAVDLIEQWCNDVL